MKPAPAVNCEWTNCPRRVGDVCCNDRPAAPAAPAVPAVPDDAALNTLARVFHSGEEIEGADGAAMMVDMALWNEGCEALESLIGEGDDETLASPAVPAVPAPFDRTTALVLLQAASKSGDPGAISLAAQLAGAAPCTDCGYVNFKCRCAAPAVPAVPDGLRDAVNALLHQIEIGDFVNSNGHSAKMLKPVHDLMRLISESAADNASLRAELARHQESEFHPDWSMLAATREGLAEHQQMLRDLRERVNVLEDALRRVRNDKSFHCLKVEKTQQYVVSALGEKK